MTIFFYWTTLFVDLLWLDWIWALTLCVEELVFVLAIFVSSLFISFPSLTFVFDIWNYAVTSIFYWAICLIWGKRRERKKNQSKGEVHEEISKPVLICFSLLDCFIILSASEWFLFSCKYSSISNDIFIFIFLFALSANEIAWNVLEIE